MKKTKIYMTFAMILLSFLIAFSLRSVSAQEGSTPTIALINPDTSNSTFSFDPETPIDTTFLANVTVTNVTWLSVWQLNITWDPTLLNVTGMDDLILPSDNVFGAYADVVSRDPGNGTLFFAVGILMGGGAPDYVNVTYGTLCQIQFTIIKNGTEPPASCNLHFVIPGEYAIYTLLGDVAGDEIAVDFTDGSYAIPEFNVNILPAIFLVATICAFIFGRKALTGKRLRHINAR